MSGRTLPTGQVTTAQSRDAVLAQRLVELADTLVDDYDVVDLLDTLVHSCVELLPVVQAGLVLRNLDGTLEVMASTSEATRLIELMQLQGDEGGPCVQAVRAGETVSVEDLAAEGQRWPRFASHGLAMGFQTVHAVPMRLRRDIIGAVNLFGGEGSTLSDSDRRVAQAMADVATIGILQQRSIHRASLVAEQLQAALTTRVVIEQAKGVLAEFGGVGMDVAFAAMRGFARRRNRKLGELAQELVGRRLPPSDVLDAGPGHRD